MLDLGLSNEDLGDYHVGLASSGRSRVEVSFFDQNEDLLTRLTSSMEDDMEDGVVDLDSSSDVDRSAALQILDPAGKLQLEGRSASSKALWPDRFVRITRYDEVSGLGWVRCHLIKGPLSGFRRVGDLVHLSVLGKEALVLPPNSNWTPKKVVKNTPIDDAIRDVMSAMGEQDFDFPANVKKKIKKRVPVPRYGDIWAIVQKMAAAGGYELFYDGRGKLVLRKPRNQYVYTFWQSKESRAVILEQPTEEYNWDSVLNRIEVVGRKPKKGKQRKNETDAEYKKRKAPPRPRFVATAPRKHELSPWEMKRNGEPRFIVERIENDHLRTKKACREYAERQLRRKLNIAFSLEFTCLAVPHLELGDAIRVETEPGDFKVVTLEKASIPLRSDASMTVGFHKSMRFKKK